MVEYRFQTPEDTVILAICGAEARGAFWKGKFEGKLELSYVGILFVRGLDPEDVCVVHDECGANGARTGEAGLIAADGNRERLCRYWLVILVQFCAHDAFDADGG